MKIFTYGFLFLSLVGGAPSHARPAHKASALRPMQFQLSLDKRAAKIGEPIAFSMKLRNTGDKAQVVRFFSGQRFDVWIQKAGEEIVWNWAANKRFSQSLSKQTLAPNGSLDFEAKWDGHALPTSQITPGTYIIHAFLMSAPRIESPPVSIEIK